MYIKLPPHELLHIYVCKVTINLNWEYDTPSSHKIFFKNIFEHGKNMFWSDFNS